MGQDVVLFAFGIVFALYHFPNKWVLVQEIVMLWDTS